MHVPRHEIEFRFVRSSGPGGQNVNKVNSKAVLRWPIGTSPSLTPAVRDRFLRRFANRITTGGEVVLSSDRYRDRERNREDCLHKLEAMLAEAAAPPKRRKRTRPHRGAVERRLGEKRVQARKKERRRRPDDSV